MKKNEIDTILAKAIQLEQKRGEAIDGVRAIDSEIAALERDRALLFSEDKNPSVVNAKIDAALLKQRALNSTADQLGKMLEAMAVELDAAKTAKIAADCAEAQRILESATKKYNDAAVVFAQACNDWEAQLAEARLLNDRILFYTESQAPSVPLMHSCYADGEKQGWWAYRGTSWAAFIGARQVSRALQMEGLKGLKLGLTSPSIR
jgi:hypothetical protein